MMSIINQFRKFHSSPLSLEEANLGNSDYGDNQQSKEQNKNTVYMRGLPYQAQDEDVVEFFKPLVPTSIEFTERMHQRDGCAIVCFSTENDAKQALLKHLQYMKNRYIELKPYFAGLNSFEDRSDRGPPRSNFVQGERTEHALYMRGLPYSASCDHISEFFQPNKPVNIEIIIQNNGWASGNCLAFFATEEDLEAALEKHLKYMGNRYIELSRHRSYKSNFGSPGRTIWDKVPVPTMINPMVTCNSVSTGRGWMGKLLGNMRLPLVENVRGYNTSVQRVNQSNEEYKLPSSFGAVKCYRSTKAIIPAIRLLMRIPKF